MKTTNTTTIRAFEKGLREIRVKDAAAVRGAIMAILGINNRVSFYNYAHGRHKLDVEKAADIAAIFDSYGVREPWGN